jgi:hypothetical protein
MARAEMETDDNISQSEKAAGISIYIYIYIYVYIYIYLYINIYIQEIYHPSNSLNASTQQGSNILCEHMKTKSGPNLTASLNHFYNGIKDICSICIC